MAGEITCRFCLVKNCAMTTMRKQIPGQLKKCCPGIFLVSNMIMECKEPVNIMFADLKDMDGSAVGQIVLQLPQDETGANKIKNYLTGRGLVIEEVDNYV